MSSLIVPSDSYRNNLDPPPLLPAPEHIKTLLPDYEITHVLGAGGFATVYKASTVSTAKRKDVALKIPTGMVDGKTIHTSTLEQFKSEADIWKKLKHRNIVRFIDSSTMPPFIAMEYMDGCSLRALMDNHRLGLGEAFSIIVQVLEGLSYAHRMATVHQDLKPENILFSSNGGAKITDWGIGKFMLSMKGSGKVKMEGTLHYTAPEQYRPETFGDVDWQTDIFQVGVMFYEMLTGENPFVGRDFLDCMGKVVNYGPEPPDSIEPEIPPELGSIVMKCIEKGKEDRWRTDVLLYQVKQLVGGGADAGTGKGSRRDVQTYKKFLRVAYSDDKITDNEARELAELRKQYGITDEMHEELVEKIKKELGFDRPKRTPEDDIKTSFDELKKLYERCRLLGMDISPFKERYTKIRGWMRFRRYKMAEDLLPGLFVELEDKASSFETELRETLEGHMVEVDSLVDDCLERGINVDEESERYHNGRSELDAGKLRDADAIFEELAQDLRSKVDEADRVGKKRSELLAVLKELSENELDISVPSGLEIKIKNDPFDAEADVDDYWQKIEAEQERRRKEAEERERTRVKALELNEKLDEKASYCRKKDIMVFSGFNDRRRNIRRQIKQGSFMDAVRELETLISQLDEHILKKEEQAKNWRKEGDDWVNSIGMRFVPIPGKNYYMGKYTVTQKEWKTVMGDTPWKGESYVKEGDDYPAAYISWNDCQQFVKKLNSKEGRNRYRLPTEEEWEHACRAGSTTKYCFGDDVSRLAEYAWYNEMDNDRYGDNPKKVGQKKPNKWGLYDMHGNVWEWCQDWDDDEREYRVVRGGSWDDFAGYCESSYRSRVRPDYRLSSLGVRLVRSSD